MTPRNKTENLLLWSAALVFAIVLSFLGALAKQLPGDAPINWRLIFLDVITTIITLAPVVAAGLGLPRFGKEDLASLVSEVGTGPAKVALEVEAARQKTDVQSLETLVERVWDLPPVERQMVAARLAERAEQVARITADRAEHDARIRAGP